MSPTVDVGLSRVNERVLLAIALVFVSTLLFAACDVGAKFIQHEASAEKIAWWRNLTYVIVALPFALRRVGMSVVRPVHPWLNILRGLTAICGTILFLLGLQHQNIPDATAIAFVSPVFVMALSIVFLGEIVGVRRWLAALVGFIGVLIIVQPGTSSFHYASIFTLVAAFVGAFSAILTRKAVRDSAETMMVWTSVIGVVVTTVLVWREIGQTSWHEAIFGLAGGLFFALGQICCVFAYRMAPASLLAPFSYVQMISATAVSYLVWGIVPGLATTVGASLIVASGLYSLHRERLRTRQRLAGPEL
ncbi:Permease of the drug/metabolite transporter (DMT) superfamily [Pleomorphomonas diazotrophica]|nr:Permease of the drug/metabolite transporter (DMT) superfamily [Pleomorphomonas diazotrophica]